MFGQLPKLFDRSFFIGFFLPASLIFSEVVVTLYAFDYVNPEMKNFLANNYTFGAASSVVIIWFISILLVAVNRPLIRLLEGYGRGNPFRIFLPRRRRQFRTRVFPLFTRLEEIIRAAQSGKVGPEQEDDFLDKVWRAVNTYPEIIVHVLPTRLGNVMRAYERYSDVVYGMEAIVLWPRIFMVIPEEARNLFREGEALFQFDLNALVAGFLSFVIYIAIAAVAVQSGNPNELFIALRWSFIPVISALLASFGWWQLPNAAHERGEQIKAIFDLYRGKLAEALGLELPTTHIDEVSMWVLVSRRITYRMSEDVKSLDRYRRKNDAQSSDQKAKARV